MKDLISISTTGLKDDEGLRLKTYTDKFGNLTIGYGRNLTAKGISKAVAEIMFKEDLDEALDECKSKIKFFNSLDTARQYVLVNMAFNMGIGGLLSFVKMLGFMQAQDWENAANQLEHSLAFEQVPNRIGRLVKILRSGEIGN